MSTFMVQDLMSRWGRWQVPSGKWQGANAKGANFWSVVMSTLRASGQ